MNKYEYADNESKRLLYTLETLGEISGDQYIDGIKAILTMLVRTTEDATQTVRDGERIYENGLGHLPDNAVR